MPIPPIGPQDAPPPDVPLAQPILGDQNGEVHVANLGPVTTQLRIILPSGKVYIKPLNQDQQRELYDLCNKIAGGGQYEIDLTDMMITRNNGMPTPLSEDDVRAIREFTGKIFQGDSKESFKWTKTYSPHARSHQEAPPSFQWLFEKTPPKLHYFEELLKDRPLAERLDLLKRNRTAELLVERTYSRLEEIKTALEGQSKTVAPDEKLKLQGRLTQIAQAQQQLVDLNHLALAFEVTHPIPHPTEEALKAKEAEARAMLEALEKERGLATKAWEGLRSVAGYPKEKGDPEAAAKELALAGIEGRKEYLTFCALLKAHPQKDSLEHLFMRLTDRIATEGDFRAILNSSLFTDTFALHSEDADALRAALEKDTSRLQVVFQDLSRKDERRDVDVASLKQRVDLLLKERSTPRPI